MGREIPCTSAIGTWSDVAQGWCRPAATQPPLTDAVWRGRTEGIIHVCTRPNGAGVPDPAMAFHRWLPTAEPATPDPRLIAQRLLAELNLQAVQLGVYPHTTDHMPGSMSVVGWNMWLWAENPTGTTWGPVTASDTVSGYTVTLTAEVSEVVWDMGNGDTVTCGKGTRWNPAYIRSEPSPDCGYVYAKDGDYEVTATTNWRVAWQGIGESGTIPLQLRRTEHLQVAEVQVVVTAGG